MTLIVIFLPTWPCLLLGIACIAAAADGDKQKSPARGIRAGLLSVLGGGRSRPEQMPLKCGDVRKAQCNEPPA
ncbi:exported hypothetical protein [uncultured Desulfovibrio sp.]|uniref:Uncharacterized protein n=1 Tax=uncultured Desulfovibrio sp. TaxID=167968 RepID=A0A212L356_9BACT|nr:exported hypothetical protein [uncultured Desulfovibrio sp.]VZH33103.1 conserved exported protein of unknown function [Desulfovibrio sp. 86]